MSTFNDPAAVARVDADSDNRSQLSTPLNGETIYFINPDKKLAVLQVEFGLVSVFDDLFIAEEGDLWNVSVSPNEDFVAIVSAYASTAAVSRRTLIWYFLSIDSGNWLQTN